MPLAASSAVEQLTYGEIGDRKGEANCLFLFFESRDRKCWMAELEKENASPPAALCVEISGSDE